MVIDDEPIVLKRLKTALEKSGYEVEIFLNGREAIERLNTSQFDIVVTDVRMDEVDGIDVLNYVRKNTPETKVVIITGYATIEMAREALVKGAFDFIAKPFKPNDLREVIERVVEAMKKEGKI